MNNPLMNETVWYDKYKYEDAERQYHEKLARVTSCSNNNLPSPLVHEKVWFDKLKYDDAEKLYQEQLGKVTEGPNTCVTSPLIHEKVWCDKYKYDDAEKQYQEQLGKVTAGSDPCVTSPLIHEKMWCEKYKYDDAERKHIEKLAKGVTNTSIKSSLASEIAKARQHIKHSLECVDGIAAMATGASVDVVSQLNSVKKKNEELVQVTEDLRELVRKLEARVKVLESKCVTSVATSPMLLAPEPKPVKTQEKKPEKEEEEEDDIDLFGSDEEDDAEAERVKEERLAQYAAKKAKKPAVIAKSSVILDVKPWDDETVMEDIEKQVRSISADGLVWGASKFVPLAYGIRKLQIMCVIEDDKISVDWLQETIEEFQDLVQSVDIAAFNKI